MFSISEFVPESIQVVHQLDELKRHGKTLHYVRFIHSIVGNVIATESNSNDTFIQQLWIELITMCVAFASNNTGGGEKSIALGEIYTFYDK